ncbi:membrane protein [Gangjinia marincola]|uniref:Membrane protein n=1 Tax=Gangjinia marincola TaxID=578463 RepID=A0ABP3XVX7_9FLAO
MIKKIIVLFIICSSLNSVAQERSSSPYSFFGVGLQKFKGTAENRAMGGLSIFSDSIHLNLQNPAGYGRLKLTTFTVAATHKELSLEQVDVTETSSNTSLNYLSLGFSAGKLGFGFGLIPTTAVGYDISNADGSNQYSGEGGLNKLYLGAGYAINDDLTIGFETSYNFGNIQNRRITVIEDILYGTRVIDRSDLRGLSFNFGAQYKKTIKGFDFHTSVSFAPEASLTSENIKNTATVVVINDIEGVTDEDERQLDDTDLTLPSKLSLGAGIGKARKWFAGAEFTLLGEGSFNANSGFNPNFEPTFTTGNSVKVGGYFIPKFNDITNYFKRIVYRAGARYEQSGLVINGEDINEFGISFGLGLPAGQTFANTNLTVEYGQRGTNLSGLIFEEFVNVSLSLSFNDRWFQKRKFN